MPSYDFITHPNSKKKVKLNSKSGQNIIQNYINYINSLFRQEGGSTKVKTAGDKKQRIIADLKAKIATKKAALANLRGEVERVDVTAASQERVRRIKQGETGESAAEDQKTLQEVEVVLATAQKSKADLEEKTQELAAELKGALVEMEKRRKAKEEGENLQCILCGSAANTLKNSFKLNGPKVLCFKCIVNKILKHELPVKLEPRNVEINWMLPGGSVINDLRGVPEYKDAGGDAAASKGKVKTFIDVTNSNFLDNISEDLRGAFKVFISWRDLGDLDDNKKKTETFDTNFKIINEKEQEKEKMERGNEYLLEEIQKKTLKKNKKKNAADIRIQSRLIDARLKKYASEDKVGAKFIDKMLYAIIPKCPYCKDESMVDGISTAGCGTMTCTNWKCFTRLAGRSDVIPHRRSRCCCRQCVFVLVLIWRRGLSTLRLGRSSTVLSQGLRVDSRRWWG